MKRTSAKVLMSILIIIIMIPFSVVKADTITASLTYAYENDLIVSNVGSGSSFYLYRPRIIYITIDLLKEATGTITINTTNYTSTNALTRRNWTKNEVQVYGATYTQNSTYQVTLSFTNTKQIVLIVGNNETSGTTPIWYQDVNTWTVNAVYDDNQLDQVIANQEAQQVSLDEIINSINNVNPTNVASYAMGYYTELTTGAQLITGNSYINNNGIAYVDITTNHTSEWNGYITTYNLYRFVLRVGNATNNISEIQNIKFNGIWIFNPNNGDKTFYSNEYYKYYLVPSSGNLILYLWDCSIASNANYKICLEFNGSKTNNVFVQIAGNSTISYWSYSLNEYYDLTYQFTVIDLLNKLSTGNIQSNNTVNESETINEQTNETINDYISLESTFTSDFTDSQEQLTTVLQNTSLTQFSNALIWFTSQLTGIYNSLGDMKILVQLPLILGIALFIIGRGAVIFREPTVERTTETWKNGNYMGTTTTQTRSRRRK